MDYIFAFFAGLFITLIAIPPLVRVAGSLRLVDSPDWRKVHTIPIPRVGGIALGLAIITATLAWAPLSANILVYIAAGAWIMLFGALDDAFDLNYKWKLLAQLPPVLLAIQSGIVMQHLPFFGLDPAPQWLSLTVTAIFFLGVTNAVNLFDGLDGLAGGCMLLSLAAIAFLGFVVDATVLVILCLILMGGILGFLNYNSHPARIFLGDAGSQFLGFSIAFFAILLTEIHHTALNPAIPFLLLGLPLVDTSWVFFLRISQGKSPFHADKQHLHHQLLQGGLRHGHAVSAIYLFQALLVGTGLAFPYGADITVVGLLMAECIGFLALVLFLRRRAKHQEESLLKETGGAKEWRRGKTPALLRSALIRIIEISLAILVLGVAAFGMPVARDIAIISLGLVAVMGFAALFLSQTNILFLRIGFYVVGAVVVYSLEPISGYQGPMGWFPAAFLFSLAVLLVGAITLTERDQFQISPQDLLVGFIALAASALREELLPGTDMGFMVVAGMLLFYACEYLISVAERRLAILRWVTFLALPIVGLRGLL